MSSRRRLGLSVGVASVLLFSGCATDPAPPTTAQLTKAPSVTFRQIGIDQVRAESAEVVTATRDLGVALAQAEPDAGGANRVVSPWSAMTALGMVRAGADGATADELDRVLGPYRPKALAALLGQLDFIGGDPGTVDEDNPPTPPVYRQGTGAFIQNSSSLGRRYLTDLSSFFDTGVYPIDFRTPQAANAINEWIAVNTGGQITQAPIPPDPDTVLSLLSTVYLGAAWDRPFTQTIDDGTFTTGPGRTVPTAMMSQTDDFRLARGAGWTALELPYGGGGLAMQVVLPDLGASVGSTLSGAVLGAVSDGLKRARPAEVSVTMPRWKIAQTVDLTTVLEGLGARRMFTPDADLSAIGEDVFVSGAAQSATITVGEKGTVAAAVTQVPMTTTGLPPAPPDTFDADRPFVYQIVDTSTSLPLFLGVVANPTAN
ncbi:serpin family protein [Williamsia phyllosphaerae]|uniref:serpin family protein n=1 Tax=Williamsia phyllosphaerae TaxID=885042 RepID=UPI001667F0F5|nr:serpin family protein [Williamsia phyllosphaerae]